MMIRRRYELSGWGSWIDGAECVWERQRETKERKTNNKRNKQRQRRKAHKIDE
jgi:hypothetical protein